MAELWPSPVVTVNFHDGENAGEGWATMTDRMWTRDSLTVDQVAAVLHLSRRSVYRLIQKGEIVPCPLKHQGKTIIPRTELDRMIGLLKSSARRFTA